MKPIEDLKISFTLDCDRCSYQFGTLYKKERQVSFDDYNGQIDFSFVPIKRRNSEILKAKQQIMDIIEGLFKPRKRKSRLDKSK